MVLLIFLTKRPTFESSEFSSVSMWSAAELMRWLPSVLCQGHLQPARSPAAETEVTVVVILKCSWAGLEKLQPDTAVGKCNLIDWDTVSLVCTCQQQLSVFHCHLDETLLTFLITFFFSGGCKLTVVVLAVTKGWMFLDPPVGSLFLFG